MLLSNYALFIGIMLLLRAISISDFLSVIPHFVYL